LEVERLGEVAEVGDEALAALVAEEVRGDGVAPRAMRRGEERDDGRGDAVRFEEAPHLADEAGDVAPAAERVGVDLARGEIEEAVRADEVERAPVVRIERGREEAVEEARRLGRPDVLALGGDAGDAAPSELLGDA